MTPKALTKQRRRYAFVCENRFNLIPSALLFPNNKIDLKAFYGLQKYFQLFSFFSKHNYAYVERNRTYSKHKGEQLESIIQGVLCASALLHVCEFFVRANEYHLILNWGKTMMKPITKHCFVETENPSGDVAPSVSSEPEGFSFFPVGKVR